MNTRTLKLSEVLTLIGQEESHFFEAKSRDIEPRRVEQLAVAFANADGGEFLIGVQDYKKEIHIKDRWLGFGKIEHLNAYLQTLFNVAPALDIRYEILVCDDLPGQILRVTVEKTSQVHKASDGHVYQRYGAQSLKVKDADRIMELSYSKGASSFEDQPLNEVEPELVVESDELTSFLNRYSPRTDPLEFCVNQNLFTSREWSPRTCSVLLFAPSPAAIAPRKCSVKVTRYETKEENAERDHLTHQETLDGPLYQLIHRSADIVSKIISDVKVITANGLAKMEYPKEAIWETLVNAIIHRDYSISDDVQVLIYDNRVEIHSPGRLPGYVNVQNILEARYARNPKIVRTLNRYPDPPNKDMGEGLNTTFQKMKEWGLREPQITEDGNYVKVVLPHVPLASPSESILEYLKTNIAITNTDARDLTGIKSENKVKTEFYKLRDLGLIERVPGKRGAKSAWQLTAIGKAHLASERET